jgi:hypothetical protein
MEAKAAAKQAQKLAVELAEYLNDRPPTIPDRIYSVLPYLLPFLDALPYGKPLLSQIGDSNFFVQLVAVLYNLYNQIPFSGLVAFFALNIISNNLQLNRLIRFNLQQAILLDIALIIPGVLGGTAAALLPDAAQLALPASTLTFALISLLLLYCAGSSLLGVTPNRIPIVSSQVESRMPSVTNFIDNLSKINKDKEKDKDGK